MLILLGAAFVCFLLAMVDEVVLPGPANAPIDKLFDSRAAAWLLFASASASRPSLRKSSSAAFCSPLYALPSTGTEKSSPARLRLPSMPAAIPTGPSPQ
jgi:hypothetical protein